MPVEDWRSFQIFSNKCGDGIFGHFRISETT